MLKTVGLVVLTAIATYAIYAAAQLRADARAVATPIGSSSSNGISFAWFYDNAERAVFVCRVGSAPGDTLDCKAKTTLP